MSTLEFDSITTVADRDYFLNDIDAIMQHLYKGSNTEDYKKFLEKFTSNERLNDIISFLNSEKITISLLEDLKKPLQDLSDKLSKLPVIEMRMALDLNEKEMREIGQHANNIIGRRVLIDAVIDTSLIAGATLAYNGFFRDYSMATKIQSVMENATKH